MKRRSTKCSRCRGTGHEPAPPPTIIGVELDIHTVSEANRSEHPLAKCKRTRQQRRGTFSSLVAMTGIRRCPTPKVITVLLTRFGPRRLDSDNLAAAFKHVRDGVADWLGRDDGDPSILWEYAQERGRKGKGLRIQIFGGLR